MKIISRLSFAFAIFMLTGPVSAMQLTPVAPSDQSLVQQAWGYGPPGHDWVRLNDLWYSPGVGPGARCVSLRYWCADRWGWEGRLMSPWGEGAGFRNSLGFQRCVWNHGC